MGRVRKGRKSSNLLFRYPRSEPSHVEFCSESFLDTATFDNHRAQHAQNLFLYLFFPDGNHSKDFKKTKEVGGL